jgi:hypothetical protein
MLEPLYAYLIGRKKPRIELVFEDRLVHTYHSLEGLADRVYQGDSETLYVAPSTYQNMSTDDFRFVYEWAQAVLEARRDEPVKLVAHIRSRLSPLAERQLARTV